MLTAVGIACELEERGDGWELRVAASDADEAAAALAEYRAERRRPPAAPLPDHAGGALAGATVAVLLLAFFLLGESPWWPADGVRRGAADAARILAGEWWRAVTALTLHADLSHVAGNCIAFAIFGSSVCRWFGPGLGLWLIVAAGAGGNALNAIVRDAPHSAIGASTAVFGAIGILAALQLHRRRTAGAGRGLMRMRAWAPLAAGLGLLALLGSSERSDLGAHLFGFAVGSVLGLLAGRWRAERLAGWPQIALAVAAGGAVYGCWSLAL